MTLKPPTFAPHPRDTGDTLLAHEILLERAHSLTAASEQVAATIRALAAVGPEDPDRPRRLKAAADAVWAYFVQRELCGFRRHDDVIREFGIGREVLNRLGAS